MIHYAEFDTPSEALLTQLEIEILKCSDWLRIGAPTTVLGTINQAVNANQSGSSGISVPTTAGMGLVVGSVISLDNGANRETRVVTGVSASQITVSGSWYKAHPIGAEIRLGNNIFKATTTRGAQMVVDLSDAGMAGEVGMQLGVYRSHDGTVGVDKQVKHLQWRYQAWTTSVPVHVTLSLSKEHFFLAIEGPRPGETGAVSAQYGSFRNYFFLSDLVPYDEEDVVPVVVSGGANMVSTSAGVQYNSHIAHVSRDLEDTRSWSPARLASLQVPSAGEASVLNVQRQREVDDRYILTPYVVFDDTDGMRGRLSSIFFAGVNQASEFSVSPPPLGTRIQYQGLWYKLIAVNKGDGGRSAWGPLGAVANESTSNYQRSIVVGVPCLP